MRTFAMFFLASAAALHAQSPLHDRLTSIAKEARGTVYVACSLPGVHLDCELEPHGHPPMQSVFKLPLAVTVLHAVDEGRLRLDQPVRFAAKDRMPGTHSPMQDKFPAAEVDVTLGDMLRYSVGDSDNVATDILLHTVGGAGAVRAYLATLGITGIRVMNGERELGLNQQVQYRNWAEPAQTVKLLRLLADKNPLKPSSAALLDDLMSHGSTGPNRLRAQLPQGTALAHKTGSSGEHNGLAAATNDVGLITLPDGRRLAIAVFVTDSHADLATRESVIARIGKATYDAAVSAPR